MRFTARLRSRLLGAAASALALIGPALGETALDLQQAGYGAIWTGYASVATCVHEQDGYDFGQFVFVCDQFTYEYPYHYGTVTLLTVSGSRVGYMCLGDTAEAHCIAGSVYRRR